MQFSCSVKIAIGMARYWALLFNAAPTPLKNDQKFTESPNQTPSEWEHVWAASIAPVNRSGPIHQNSKLTQTQNFSPRPPGFSDAVCPRRSGIITICFPAPTIKFCCITKFIRDEALWSKMSVGSQSASESTTAEWKRGTQSTGSTHKWTLFHTFATRSPSGVWQFTSPQMTNAPNTTTQSQSPTTTD